MASPDKMSRDELLQAKARVEHQLSELSYAPIAGGGGGTASPKPALFERLKEILKAIDEELAEIESPNT